MPGLDDLSDRLAAALQKSAAKSSAAPPPGAVPAEMQLSGVFTLPAAPSVQASDDFSKRLTSALGRARGEDAPAVESDPAAVTGVAAAQPVGQGDYLVRSGDCMSSIGLEFGYFPDTIWNDPANSELKQIRENPNVLLAGDRVTIPEKRRKEEACAAEQRHRFKRRGCPETLQVKFEDADGKPYATVEYEITIDGKTRNGFSDGDGIVREPIPPDAKHARIRILKLNETYDFSLGMLEPVESVKGLQSRLNNLGFFCGPATGQMNSATERALREFQKSINLPNPTGRPDDETRQQLKQKHAS